MKPHHCEIEVLTTVSCMKGFWGVKLASGVTRILVPSVSGSQKRFTSWTAWLWRSRHCSPSNTGIYPKTASYPRWYKSVFQLLYMHTVSKLSRYSYEIYKWKISVCIGMYFCFILWLLTSESDFWSQHGEKNFSRNVSVLCSILFEKVTSCWRNCLHSFWTHGSCITERSTTFKCTSTCIATKTFASFCNKQGPWHGFVWHKCSVSFIVVTDMIRGADFFFFFFLIPLNYLA